MPKLARTLLTTLLALALGGATLLACACGPTTDGRAHSNVEANPTEGQISDMRLAPVERVADEDPQLAFAANTAMAVLNGPDADASNGDPNSFQEKNLCFSPASLYLACSLLGLGTQGTANDQLLTLLGVEDADGLRAESALIRQSLENVYGDAAVEVADSIWAGDGYEFTDAFLKDVEALGGAAFDVSFGTNEANEQIQEWISKQTNGLIKPDISTQLGQAAMLINTIYFKDAWQTPFSASNTEQAEFRAPGLAVQADYLRGEITDSMYAEGDGFKAANLGFSGGASVTFVRPNDDVMLYQLFASAKQIRDLFALELEFRSVDWWLPKFQTDSSLRHLIESLRSLGVTNAFSPETPAGETNAFAPMIATDAGEGFYVSDVQQDTHLALDEAGVEAAAATSMGISKMSLGPEDEPVEFKLDRSFLYYVTSPDGVVLFVGVVYNPDLS